LLHWCRARLCVSSCAAQAVDCSVSGPSSKLTSARCCCSAKRRPEAPCMLSKPPVRSQASASQSRAAGQERFGGYLAHNKLKAKLMLFCFASHRLQLAPGGAQCHPGIACLRRRLPLHIDPRQGPGQAPGVRTGLCSSVLFCAVLPIVAAHALMLWCRQHQAASAFAHFGGRRRGKSWRLWCRFI
jgi:hypothetical protein